MKERKLMQFSTVKWLHSQSYLGLSFSDSKLPKEVFLPYISSVVKIIDFSFDFIIRGGRLTLTKSVLTALAAYLMCCIKVPEWVIHERG
jgi:hypothetical protein